MASIFPPEVSSNGRYLVDVNGIPFPVFGEASWDAHINLSLTDLKTYLDDRQALGYTALFTYITNPVAYAAGSQAPWMQMLGGISGGNSALPFTLNTSGTSWNGDPTFANHDAAFSSPNDSWHADFQTFCSECDKRNILVIACPMYLGFNLGASDGWYQTLTNAANTQSVCQTYGQYLCNGHGTFAGLKNQGNLVFVFGGDTFPPVGSEAAARMKKICTGYQAAGGTQLWASHWQHEYKPADQTDVSALLNIWHSYTHGVYPTAASTAGMTRALYSAASVPVYLIETNYWGNYGQPRASLRLFQWHAWLSGIAGAIHGYSPMWNFVTSANGTTGSSVPGSTTTAWQANFDYTQTPWGANTYVSNGSPQRWYILKTAGTSAGSGGPTGTGSSITDNGCTWAYVTDVSATLNGYANSPILRPPAVLDNQHLGLTMKSIRWWTLVPSGLSSMITLITAGGGTAPTWSDQSTGAVGGMTWIAAAADPAGTCEIAYVPDQHSGSFTIDLSKMIAPYRLDWVDPTNGARQNVARYSASSSRSLTVPGANSSGDNDWVLLAQPEGYVPPSPFQELC